MTQSRPPVVAADTARMIGTDDQAVEVEQLLAALAETPQRIAAAAEALGARLYAGSGEVEWSANEILAHLRACADVWGKSIQTMIAQDHPTLRYISPRTWIRKTDYTSQEFHESLQAFTTQRAELLAVLSGLDAAGWLRGATFTGTTRGRDQTVLSYARRIVEHERDHCLQVASLVG